MPSDDRGIESSGMESATFLIMVAERVEWEACGGAWVEAVGKEEEEEEEEVKDGERIMSESVARRTSQVNAYD